MWYKSELVLSVAVKYIYQQHEYAQDPSLIWG